MDSAVVLFALAALGHFPLHHLEHFRVDDGFMVVLDIVLRDFAFVDLGLLGQEIDGVAFLKERIAFVLLIAEDALDGGDAPFFLAAGCRDAVFGQCICSSGHFRRTDRAGVPSGPHHSKTAEITGVVRWGYIPVLRRSGCIVWRHPHLRQYLQHRESKYKRWA